MQEVFEKLIKKLEEKKLEHSVNGMQHEDSEVFLLEREEYGKFQGLKEAIEIVKQEAAEYNNGWISCSERLPDSSCDVIIVTRSLVNGVGSYFGEDSGWIQWYSGGGIAVDVIAWQPLPEPYQPNVCNASDCPINDGKECLAAEGCAGYEQKGE